MRVGLGVSVHSSVGLEVSVHACGVRGICTSSVGLGVAVQAVWG